MMSDSYANNTPTVLILFFILVLLVLLLLYLYKRLNHETKGKYTIQRLVLGDGGLRDRVMHGVAEVEARLGDRLRSQTHDEEQTLSNNEDGNSGREEDAGQSHSENENKTEEKDLEHHNDSSEDYSSVDLQERVKKNNSKEKEEEQEEEDVAKGDDSKQDEDGKNEERVGLLVDLKTFSGSAIWSGEKTEETNVTAL